MYQIILTTNDLNIFTLEVNNNNMPIDSDFTHKYTILNTTNYDTCYLLVNLSLKSKKTKTM